MMRTCSMCNHTLDEHDRDIRFRLPDPVLHTTKQERAPGTWISHFDPMSSVMMQVDEVGPFVRALLPVRLTGGYTVTFGVWVGISPDDLQRTFALWWEPEYQTLTLDGFLANNVPPWDVLGAPVRLTVRDPDETPYCESSGQPELSAVLADEWDHELVLSALP